MKYFTKEFYNEWDEMTSNNINESIKMRKRLFDRYNEETQHMRSNLSYALRDALCIYDGRLASEYWDNGNYILEFELYNGFNDTKKLVFTEVIELYKDDLQIKSMVECVEIYAHDNAFEIHLLFRGYSNGERTLRELTVISKSIEYEVRFRNIGKCKQCGTLISDPSIEDYISYSPKILPGVYSNSEWICNSCQLLN